MEQTINLVWSFHPVACMSPPVEGDVPLPHGNRPLPTRGINPRPSQETGLIPLVSGPIGATNALTEITGNADENSAGLGGNPTNGVATTRGAQGKNPALREPHSGKTRVIPAAKAWGFPCGNIILALRAWQDRPTMGGKVPGRQNPTFWPPFPVFPHRIVHQNCSSVEYPRLGNQEGKPPEGDFYRVGLKLLSSVRDT